MNHLGEMVVVEAKLSGYPGATWWFRNSHRTIWWFTLWGHPGGLPRWLGAHGGLPMCPFQ
jgi:hypothetical protein